MEAWQRNMNEDQQRIISHGEGPLFVPAQAGTGKTRAVVNRIARLVYQDEVPEEEILAVTFSRKAAEEMNARLAGPLGVRGCRVSTWHALALQILKGDRHEVADWAVDERDQHRWIVRDALRSSECGWAGANLTDVLSWIAVCKADLLLPGSGSSDLDDSARELFGEKAERAVIAFHLSDEELHARGLLTFDDMLVFAALHLDDPSAAQRWSERWRYVMQDEAQDVNLAQMRIAAAIAAHGNYMIVGDPDQSIYGFRGASPAHFLAFEDEWKATRVSLTTNYRCARSIVAFANRMIAKASTPRLDIVMTAHREEVGSVEVVGVADFDEEGKRVADWVKELGEDGVGYSDVAVLYRTNAQSRALEDALLTRRIPYVVVGGISFYERREVAALLAYLRLAAGRGKRYAVEKCGNAPFRFLSKRFLSAAQDAYRGGASLMEAMRSAERDTKRLGHRQRQAVDELVRVVTRAASGIEREQGPSEILQQVVSSTKFRAWLEKDQGSEGSIDDSALANVRELQRIAGRFADLDEMLDYVDRTVKASKRQQKAKTGERVVLMTIHRSKGLEWRHVWVAGMNEEVLPHALGDAEEERRLAYVAATRARDGLVLSHVSWVEGKEGRRSLSASRFIADGLCTGEEAHGGDDQGKGGDDHPAVA